MLLDQIRGTCTTAKSITVVSTNTSTHQLLKLNQWKSYSRSLPSWPPTTTQVHNNNNIGILSLNYNTNTSTTITLPTSRTITVRDLTAASKLAVCTEQAFYLLSYSGSVLFTLPYPSLYTRKCRITTGWASVAGEYYLTAISQQLSYNPGSITYPLWNIWKIDTIGL